MSQPSMTQDSKTHWYQKKRVVIPTLLFIPPVGIPLVWLTPWSKRIKISASVVSGLILLGSLGNQKPAVQMTAVVPSPIVSESPSAVAQPSSVKKEWFEDLPAEDLQLRNTYLSDTFLYGYLLPQDARFVHVANAQELIKKGFFINASWKHTGAGLQPEGEARASCSMLDFSGENFVCGRGAGWQWGIQSDKAVERFIAIMRTRQATDAKPEPLPQEEQQEEVYEDDKTSTSVEAVLTADDLNSQINLRDTPSAEGKRRGYGLVGDQVQVLNQTTAEGSTWYQVQFPKSGAVGWIRGDFVSLINAKETRAEETGQTSSESSTYSSPSTSDQTYTAPTTSTSSSSGTCDNPEQLDSAGRRCGARAASVRSGGRKRR